MDRKAFNFYKSYYDVAFELPDEDRNEFVWAIVSAQFTGELVEPKSKLARLMFLGQRHSILKQLEGFKAATNPPSEAPPKGPPEAPSQQVQEQGQVQEKEKGQGGSNIKVYGEASDKFFIVNSKYLNEPKYKVHHTGFKDFADEALMGTWFKKEFLIDIFWEQWSGKMFNDVSHVNNVMLNINNPKKHG